MITLHEERDPEKTARLAKNMQEHGWEGSPLVVDGDQLITGTHRYFAAVEIGIEPPVIQLDELFAREGLDMQVLHEQHGYPTLDESAWVDFLYELSVETRQKYGIDLH